MPDAAITVLYAEDHKIVADAVSDTLESEGWSVVTCNDGISALQQIESHAHYDVLLLDNQLPGIDGIELVRRTRALPHRKNIPVIIISATECERDALQAGADLFLSKPEGMRMLVKTISGLLARL